MRRIRTERPTRVPRHWATSLPVLIATLAATSMERALHPASRSTEVAASRGLSPADRPLRTEASAEEVFDWLRSIERIDFERTMELRLDVEASDSETTRLRAIVSVAPENDLVEEER